MSYFQKFLKLESTGGIILGLASVLAIIIANSPLADFYHKLWHIQFGFTSEYFTLVKPLHLWINDGLMAIFFFLIGLEIKREIYIGELNSLKKIMFPLIGALGGVLVPILIFSLLINDPVAAKGWGIPMATDIAFSLAILKAFGNRIPLSLKVFLTAFAIIDDLAAIFVIAIFYSGSIKLNLILIALGLLLFMYLLSYWQFYSKILLFIVGIVVWTLFLKSGIHPTLAGVLLAFSVPIRQKIKTKDFIAKLSQITRDISQTPECEKPFLSPKQINLIDELETWIEDFQSPLQQLEHKLHNWVAYLILPLFAFANAGISFKQVDQLNWQLSIVIAISLFAGKSLGIWGFVTLAKKLKIIQVPQDIENRHLIGVSILAGIGFTMSIFIANLAFGDNLNLLYSAIIGILIASITSAILGSIVLLKKSTK